MHVSLFATRVTSVLLSRSKVYFLDSFILYFLIPFPLICQRRTNLHISICGTCKCLALSRSKIYFLNSFFFCLLLNSVFAYISQGRFTYLSILRYTVATRFSTGASSGASSTRSKTLDPKRNQAAPRDIRFCDLAMLRTCVTRVCASTHAGARTHAVWRAGLHGLRYFHSASSRRYSRSSAMDRRSVHR